MSLSGTLGLHGMRADHLGIPLATDLVGEIAVEVDGLDRKARLDRAFFDAFSTRILLDGEVGSLDFLDYYLAGATWLQLSGAGHVHAELHNTRGEMLPESRLTIDVADMRVGFLGWEVGGACAVRLDLGGHRDLPGTRLTVAFHEYTVWSAAEGDVEVVGEGFEVRASTPDVSFYEPFTALEIDLVIPDSEVPSFSSYSALLPPDSGIRISGGSGRVRGYVHAGTGDNAAHGEIFLTGEAIRIGIGDVAIHTDLTVHGKLTHGQLDTGVYDIAGTQVALTDVRVESPNQPDAITEDWSASIGVTRGSVRVGQSVYFDGVFALRCRDSVPFLTMFEEKRSLPGIARRLFTIRDIDGTAHLRLGLDAIDLSTAAFHGKTYEILMHLRRQRQVNRGALFVRLGPLAVGIGIDGAQKHVQVGSPKKWYEATRGEGADEVAEEAPVVKPPRERAERRRERKARK